MPGKYGEKVVIRIIDTYNGVTRLAQPGFSPNMLDRFRSIAHDTGGYTPLRSDGMDKIRAGLATVDELMTATTV